MSPIDSEPFTSIAVARGSRVLDTGRGVLDRYRGGVCAVLELRSRYGAGGEPLTDPERYIDLSWYRRATGGSTDGGAA